MKNFVDSSPIEQSKWFFVSEKSIPSIIQKMIDETNIIYFWNNQYNLSCPLSNSII